MRRFSLSMLFLSLGACAISSEPANTDDAGSRSDAGPSADAGNAADAGSNGNTVTIQQLREGAVAVETNVTVEAAVVTAISPGRGLWVQQGTVANSGLFLFGEEVAALEGLAEGKEIDLSGVYTVYNDLAQIKFPTITAMRDGTLPQVVAKTAAELVAEPQWEGMLVRVDDVAITDANPDGPDNDYGQVTVTDGLIIDDDLFRDFDSGRFFLRQVGTEFESVTGIAHISFGARKLLPRRAEDVVVVGGAPDFTTTIQAIQQGEHDEGSPVALEGAVVTAVSHPSNTDKRGLWIQQGRGAYSGIYIYFGRDELPQGVEPGAVVNVSGEYSEFYGQSQLVRCTVEVTGAGSVPEPSTVIAGELAGAADGENHATAEPWEGVLVRVEGVTVTKANADADNGLPCVEGDENCRDFGTIEVSGGLRLTNRIYPDLASGQAFPRVLGTAFTAVVGIAEEAFGNHSLAPRGEGDLQQ